MFVYHPPLTIGWPAMWMSLVRRIPFIYEIQDLWPESLQSTGMVNNSFVLNAITKLAQIVYRRAAAISVISGGFRENLIGKGVPEERIHVIPNWADESVYRPVCPDSQLATQHGLAGRFNVVFAGNIGPAQGLDSVLEAAALLKDLPTLQIVLIGDGLTTSDLKEQAQRDRLNNVCFIDRQPAERMASFLALADVLLVHLRGDALFEVTIPSKTFSYLACGKPILMAVPGDAAAVVQQARAGLCCASCDPVAMARALRELFFMAPETRRAMGQAGRREFLARYSERVLLDRYEALFRLVSRAGRNQRSAISPERQSIG